MRKKDALKIIVGKKIAQLRNKKGWTQQDLEEYSDLAQNSISKIENGHTNAKLSTLEAIADAFQMEAGQLLIDAVVTPFGKAKNFDKAIEMLKDKDEDFVANVITFMEMQLSNKK